MPAKIVLYSADAVGSNEVAAFFDEGPQTVSHCPQRDHQQGILVLYDDLRSGRSRSIDDQKGAALVNNVLKEKPRGATHCAVRSFQRETRDSKSQIQRHFNMVGLQSHRSKSFKLSTDAFFVEKVRSVFGLYVKSPNNDRVLFVDDRHGTTSLFAALNVASQEGITQCKAHYRHQELLSFSWYIDKNIPNDLDLYLMVDNYVTQKNPKVKAWLANRLRYHIHCTPPYSYWFNQIERWFGHVKERSIRRGTFKSLKDLKRCIDQFFDRYKRNYKPHIFMAAADSVLEQVTRITNTNSRTSH